MNGSVQPAATELSAWTDSRLEAYSAKRIAVVLGALDA